jgi:hypothetical protein
VVIRATRLAWSAPTMTSEHDPPLSRGFPGWLRGRVRGASEIGLLRGLDLYRLDQGNASLAALGVALVDCGGGERIDRMPAPQHSSLWATG